MKKKFLNIAALSFFITTMGFLLDSDPTEPSMKMRFIEFYAMATIIFAIISTIYFSSAFLIRKIKRA